MSDSSAESLHDVTGGTLQEKENLLEEEKPRKCAHLDLIGAIILSGVWLVMLGGMPFFNKAIFRSYLGGAHTLAPALTPTLIQMMGASVALVFLEVGRHYVFGAKNEDWLFSKGKTKRHCWSFSDTPCTQGF